MSLFRNRSADILAWTLILVTAGACGAESEGPPERADDVSDADGGATLGEPSPYQSDKGQSPMGPEPFSIEFEQLVPQSVRWAGFDVSVTGVRQVRGLGEMDSESAGTPWEVVLLGQLDPNSVYVEIDLALENKGTEELDYRDRDSWDLRLADGTRLASVDALGISALGGDTATTSLHYEVADMVDLAGAELVLEGGTRGTFEPEPLPLDRAVVPTFPRRIPSLEGQVVDFVTYDRASVHIDQAVFDVNHARRRRTALGMRVVWLELAFFSANGAHYSTGDLRVAVNGRASAPTEWEHGVIEEGTTEVFFAGFEIDASASAFDLVFPNGAESGTRIMVNIADTVFADDIP